MSAIARYWQNFARWVKRGHVRPLQTIEPIPMPTWADLRDAYDRAQKSHHGRGEAGAQLRAATRTALIKQIFDDEAHRVDLTLTHPWLFRDPEVFTAAVKAAARRRVAEARR